jgi:GNAT superfamily N-acetyltransferase
MNDIQVRRATREDLPVLLLFEQEIVRAERPFDPTLKPGKIHYYDIGQMIESTEAAVFVAWLNGSAVGSGHVRIRLGEPYNTFEKYAFLGFMYVSPEHRGRGIIQLIVQEIKQWALQKGLRELRLQVYDENIPAIRAYEKADFKKLLTEMRMSLHE